MYGYLPAYFITCGLHGRRKKRLGFVPRLFSHSCLFETRHIGNV